MWGHRGVQQGNQMLDDILFFTKDRSPSWLGRMGREYRFNRERVE